MELLLDNLEAYAPVVLRGIRFTDDEFMSFCAEHEDLRIESNPRGEVEVMPGTSGDTGYRNSEITHQLHGWAKSDGRGRTFDSSTMFVLPSGARRSPDASWIPKERIAAVPARERGRLWHLCPDFVIELKSSSDRTPDLLEKMQEWMENGAQLGWLIDPERRQVTIYRPNGTPEVLAEPASLHGEGPVAGFVLDLAEIWAEG